MSASKRNASQLCVVCMRGLPSSVGRSALNKTLQAGIDWLLCSGEKTGRLGKFIVTLPFLRPSREAPTPPSHGYESNMVPVGIVGGHGVVASFSSRLDTTLDLPFQNSDLVFATTSPSYR